MDVSHSSFFTWYAACCSDGGGGLQEHCCFAAILAVPAHVAIVRKVRPKAMAQHWTIDDFIAELGHLDSLAQTSPSSAVVQSMTNAFIARIQGASNWTSAGIVAMLQRANTMQAEVRPSLVAAIESLNTMTGSHLRLTCSGQKVLDFCPYLTTTDWECMSGGIIADSMSMLAKRMRSMGITSAKECLVKHAIALLLWQQHALGKPMPSPTSIHDMVEDFKTILLATPMPAAHGAGVLVYPMTPQEMGRDWITAAYGSHGPAGRTVQLAHWSKAIPMRSTSALLKSMPNPAQVKPSEFPGDTHGQNLAGVAGALVQLLNKWAPSSSPSSSLPALQDGHAGKVQFMLPGQGHQAQSALALPSSEPSQKPIATPARAPSVHLPCRRPGGSQGGRGDTPAGERGWRQPWQGPWQDIGRLGE